LKDLAERSGVGFTAHYHMTTVDPPEVVHFTRRYHPDVVFDVPRASMWKLIREHGCLPTRKVRYCCRELKESHGKGMVLMGVRRAESINRRGRGIVEQCARAKTRYMVNPIVDWTDEDIWEYIHARGLPYCSLYDEGWKRVGCVLCPFSDQQKEAERWPKIAGAYRRAANEVWSPDRDMKHNFKSGDDYFEWWLTGRALASDEDQLSVFGEG